MNKPLGSHIHAGDAPRELKRGEVSAIHRAASAYKLRGEPSGWRKWSIKPSGRAQRSNTTP